MTTFNSSERLYKYFQSQIMHPTKLKYTRLKNFNFNFKVTRFYLDLQGNQDFRAPTAKILPHRDRISIRMHPHLVCNALDHLKYTIMQLSNIHFNVFFDFSLHHVSYTSKNVFKFEKFLRLLNLS